VKNKEEEKPPRKLNDCAALCRKFFHESLLETDEGKSIGLSYFKERGFSNDTIRSLSWVIRPTNGSIYRAGFERRLPAGVFLEQSGLSVKRDNGSLYAYRVIRRQVVEFTAGV